MQKKAILVMVVIGVMVAGGVATWFYFPSRNNKESKVFVSGNIEAIEVDLSFRISGQIKTLNVDEGDRVARGQVIATLDTDTLEALRGVAKAEIAAARATLDELEEGTREEEIARSRALMKAAESKLKNAEDEYQRYKSLREEGAISQSLFENKLTTYTVALEEFNNASQHLRELVKGPREQEIRAARARLERATWELNKIELDIEHSVLTTPVSGVVLVKANELGEVVLPGATVATIAEIDEVWLKGYISEEDLGKVKHGQEAEITIDTFPGRTYPGVVTFISSRAEFTPKNVQTKEERVKQVYRVKITIPNRDHDLKIGMPAEGYVLVDSVAVEKRGKDDGGRPAS